tara:strand:+ start:90 stop:566 length:477 start_codon:yes stop_codon:yes gene_type:complete
MANKLPYRGNSRRKNNAFFNSGIERLLTRVDNLEKVERTEEEGGVCAANIGFDYQIDDSVSAPGSAVFSGNFGKPGTYDMSISVTDYKGNTHTDMQAHTDTFSIDFGNMASWNGTGVYDVNISVTNQADAECGPYCSIQTAVPPSVNQDITALAANCP